ncbi:MAG: DUF433 domain-containing protein [Vicinamibacteraceae bacterium]
MTFDRIVVRRDVCTGKPCIRDLRFPVSRSLGLLAARHTREQILQPTRIWSLNISTRPCVTR